MVIERFHDGDPLPVYRRLRDEGRHIPAALTYLGSWVSTDLTTCYQIMECDRREQLDDWIAHWTDLVDFEIIAVRDSAAVVAEVQNRL